MSELTRTALSWMRRQPGPRPAQSLEARVAEVEGRVRLLMAEVQQLQRQAGQTTDRLLTHNGSDGEPN